MNRIRINMMLDYFTGSLTELVDACYDIKNKYTRGEISYKRAARQFDRAMRQAWSRLKLCENLSAITGCYQSKIATAREDLIFLTAWNDD